MLRPFAIGLLLVAAIAAVYAPVRDHAFVEFDDPLYVRDNPVVSQGLTVQGVGYAFGSGQAYLWHPLTWLSLMVGVEVHGADDAGAFALTNVALHAVNALVLFAVLASLTGRLWPSALAAALFALHPLRVESVAWVTGRKDVLSALFALLAIGAYAGWVRRGGGWRYGGVVALYALSLMAKPAHFALPLLLLLLDAWPLARMRTTSFARLAVEKLPMLALGVATAAVTAAMLGSAPSPWGEDLPLHQRVAAAPVALLFYLAKTVWPAGLAVVYPAPHHMGLPFYGTATLAAAWAAILALAAAVAWAGRRHPYVAMGFAWFALAIAPTLQLLPTGLRVPHDRYTYLSSIGLFVALAFAGAEAWRRRPDARPWLAAAAGLALLACAVQSARQVSVWRDSETLFAHSLAVTGSNALVLFSRGVMHGRAGDEEAAIADFRAALAIHPGHADSHNSLGYVLFRRGDLEPAIRHLREALALRPDYPLAMTNLANALDASGQGDEALLWLRRAVEIAPDSADAHYWLGRALARRRDLPGAVHHFQWSLGIDPTHRFSREALQVIERELSRRASGLPGEPVRE